jgi:FixJ family two-component response regulator
VQAMKMGAMDFLENPFKQSVLIERIDAALAMDQSRRKARVQSSALQNRFESLTEREREIALLIVKNPASNSSKDIARHLDISPRTVDHHRARILDKMNVGSVAQLLEFALKANLFSDQ